MRVKDSPECGRLHTWTLKYQWSHKKNLCPPIFSKVSEPQWMVWFTALCCGMHSCGFNPPPMLMDTGSASMCIKKARCHADFNTVSKCCTRAESEVNTTQVHRWECIHYWIQGGPRGPGSPWSPDLEAPVIQFGGPVYNLRAKQWILGPFF